MERRLVAILAADMVGYSRLMEVDEEATIIRQKTHRSELIDPAIAEHDGRIVKTTGDGLLVEFPSVVDAVRCAVAIQRAMVEREADVPEERRIRYRVGTAPNCAPGAVQRCPEVSGNEIRKGRHRPPEAADAH